MSENNNTSLSENKNLRYAGIAAIIALIVAPIVANMFSMQWAVVVMVEIAVVAFFTVLFVMIIGSQEDHYPSAAEDSPSVAAWSQRLGAAEQAKVEETVENIEASSGPTDES